LGERVVGRTVSERRLNHERKTKTIARWYLRHQSVDTGADRIETLRPTRSSNRPAFVQMLKSSRRAGGDSTKPIATDTVEQCCNCHVPQKAQDFTFSKYLE
jgi:hypothetical protein